jgi:hypothetical protein
MFQGVGEVRGVAAGARLFLAGIGGGARSAPALDAARAAPARALKAGDEQALFQRMTPLWPGAALLGLGIALAQFGPVRGLPLFGYASIACLLLGAIALAPWAVDLHVRPAAPAAGSRSRSCAARRGSPW